MLDFTASRGLKLAGALGLCVYLYDCYHVWKVYSEEMDFVENMELTEEDEKRFESFYEPYKPSDQPLTSDKKMFELELEHLHELKNMEKRILSNPASLDNAFRVSRESILFGAGSRAAFLQNAHPYVATGVVEHSDLKNSIHRRFILTFKHVFAINFGGWESAARSAKEVRRLHDKVVGEIKEDVGFFKQGHKYRADNIHSLYWVHQTLVEGAILMHEMFVRRLSDEEKQAHYETAFFSAAAFGIPQKVFPKTYAEFKIEAAKFMKSPILTVGADSRDIQRFLLSAETLSKGRKPRFSFIVAAQFAKWLTLMTLPRNVAKQYFNRVPSNSEVLTFVLLGGFVKFFYRLTPKSIRYLNPYFYMLERNGTKLNVVTSALNRWSGDLANYFIFSIFPGASDLKKKEF